MHYLYDILVWRGVIVHSPDRAAVDQAVAKGAARRLFLRAWPVMEGRVRIINKRIEIVRGSGGKLKVREIVMIACDDHDEALRVESALKARLEETIRVVEAAAKPGRFPPTVDA